MKLESMSFLPRRALSIPLLMDGVGEMDIQVMIS
jgi:chemotaxis protein CheX